jgi:RES domain-containing protein
VTTPEPRPWSGTVYRHLPAGSPYGPLDTRFAARSRENRWNRAGEPTLVLAGNRELPAIEFGRHIAHDRNNELAALYQQRQVFAIELRLHRVFDLTDAATLDALGIEDTPACFADRSRARATAGFLRHVRNADGLLVPSLAALEDPTHWNLLVFLDRLSELLATAVQRTTPLGTFQPERLEPQPSAV